MALCRDGLKGEILDPNDYGLHPLIHTRLESTLVQDFGGWQDRLLRDSDATMIMQP